MMKFPFLWPKPGSQGLFFNKRNLKNVQEESFIPVLSDFTNDPVLPRKRENTQFTTINEYFR